MGNGKRTGLAEYAASRIALIKPSALGDIVHALPVLGALRHRFPKAHIAWVINHSYADLVHGHPDLDEILCFDRGAIRSSWWRGGMSFLQFLADLRRRRYDLVIDLQGLLRAGLMSWASGAARRVGLSSAREGASWFYTDTLAAAIDQHAVDRYWVVAEALGVDHIPKRFDLPVRPVERRWAQSLLNPRPRPWIMMNVGTRWETKRWPVEHFLTLALWSIQRYGGTIVLVGAADEQQLAARIAGELPGFTIDLTGQTTLSQLVSVLEAADVMVSNDSGPLHVAAALGRPVVAPFTCTSPIRTGPYGQGHRAVATRVPCAASYLKRCRQMICMNELTPEHLWPVLEAILQSCPRRSA